MGCSTCKKSNTATMNPEDVEPFILLVLVVQLFLTLFLPKKLPSASKKFKDFLMGIFSKYAEFKVKRTMKKRERQFKNTTEYVNKDIEEVEIYDNEE
jgi:Sec-independent protein translocase protein TatA